MAQPAATGLNLNATLAGVATAPRLAEFFISVSPHHLKNTRATPAGLRHVDYTGPWNANVLKDVLTGILY
jgi:hypothetical protein